MASSKLLRSKISEIKDVQVLSYQLLLKQAQLVFNAWIRKRDQEKGCVSCKSKKVRHASHYYSAGSFLGLRFCEENTHGSCEQCNTFLYGNLEAYRKELLIRIGAKSLRELDRLAGLNKRKKYSRAELLEIIAKYRI
ncbi:MAG: recombination protein NinG [Bacteroidota bacterium]